jgi:hypothetical protein
MKLLQPAILSSLLGPCSQTPSSLRSSFHLDSFVYFKLYVLRQQRDMQNSYNRYFYINLGNLRMGREAFSLLTLQSTVVTICTTFYKTRRLCILPTQCIRVFRTIITMNSEYFSLKITYPAGRYYTETVFPVRYELNI